MPDQANVAVAAARQSLALLFFTVVTPERTHGELSSQLFYLRLLTKPPSGHEHQTPDEDTGVIPSPVDAQGTRSMPR